MSAISFQFSLSTSGDEDSFGNPATVTLQVTQLPVPDENRAANFENVQLQLTGSDDDSSDSIVAARITHFPDSSFGTLYADQNMTYPITAENSIVEANSDGNIYIYYASLNTSENLDPIADTSFQFQIASQINPNYNLNWSTQSATVYLDAYSPPELTITPVFANQNDTTLVPIVVDLVYDSTYGKDDHFTVTQLPTKGTLYDDNGNIIDTNTDIDRDTIIYYQPETDSIETDSFDISYTDEITTSNTFNVDLLIGAPPQPIDSNQLSFAETDTPGTQITFTHEFNVNANPFTDTSIDTWKVNTYIHVTTDTTIGSLEFTSVSSSDNPYLLSASPSNLSNIPQTLEFKYTIDSASVGRIEDSFQFHLRFEFLHEDSTFEPQSLTGAPETFSIMLYRPPVVSDLTQYVSNSDVGVDNRIEIDLSNGNSHVTHARITTLPDSTYGTLYYTSVDGSTPVETNSTLGKIVYYEHTHDYTDDPISATSDTFQFQLADTDANDSQVWSINHGTVTLSFIPVANDLYISYASSTSRIQIALSDDTNIGFTIQTLPESTYGVLYLSSDGIELVSEDVFYTQQSVWFEPTNL